MDLETLKLVSSGGVGVACLGTLIWVVRFVLTRVEVALKENTEAIKGLIGYFRSHNMYVSGGKDGE